MPARPYRLFQFSFLFTLVFYPLFSATFVENSSFSAGRRVLSYEVSWEEEKVAEFLRRGGKKARHGRLWGDLLADYEQGLEPQKPKKPRHKKKKTSQQASPLEMVKEEGAAEEGKHTRAAALLEEEVGAMEMVQRADDVPAPSVWLSLPPELWDKILLEYAGVKVATTLSFTCRQFYGQFKFLRNFVIGGSVDPVSHHLSVVLRKLFHNRTCEGSPLSFKGFFSTADEFNHFVEAVFNTQPIEWPVPYKKVKLSRLDLRNMPSGNLKHGLQILGRFIAPSKVEWDRRLVEGPSGISNMGALLSAVGGNSVKALNLAGMNLNDGQLAPLFALGKKFHPEEIDLSHNQIGRAVSRDFQRWFQQGKHPIRVLDVSYNPVEDPDQFLNILASRQGIKTSLEVLRLRGLGLCYDHYWALYHSLFKTPAHRGKLQVLDLRDNQTEIDFRYLLTPVDYPTWERRFYGEGVTLYVQPTGLDFPNPEELGPGIHIVKNGKNNHRVRIQHHLSPHQVEQLVKAKYAQSIRHLEIYGEMAEEGLNLLFNFPQLETLSLSIGDIADPVLLRLNQERLAHPTLKALNLLKGNEAAAS